MDYSILVNKEHPLDKNYIPCDLVEYSEYNGSKIDHNHKTLVNKTALDAFFKLQVNAKLDGHHIVIDSAYRSYNYQMDILNHYLEYNGNQAYSFVVLPGTSEHQTGLAIDISVYKNGEYTDKLSEDMPEIVWMNNNAWRFGFILRYPKDCTHITGFKYEYWHFRYVGNEIAKEMHDKNIKTLEEYKQNKKHR